MFDFIWNDIMIGPVMNGLVALTHAIGGNFGLAIIIFTIATRIITYPLTLRQLRATRAMQQMSPRMQEIQKNTKTPSAARKS